MRRIVLACAFVGVVSCAAAPSSPPSHPMPPAPVSASPPSASAFVPPPLPPLTPCELALREERAKLRPYFLEQRRTSEEFDGRDFVARACRPDDHGAWLLAVSNVVVIPSTFVPLPFPTMSQPSLSGRLRPVRIAEDGRRFEGPDAAFLSDPSYDQSLTFDWDGDGIPELAAYRSYEAGYEVWTFADGKVVRDPAVTVSPLRIDDVDHDGRPDLLYTAPYDGMITMFGNPIDVRTVFGDGWFLVAHAKPDGSFSLDDDVATSAVRAGCDDAEIPKKIEKNDYGNAVGGLAVGIRCALLRGEPPPKVLQAVAKACKTYRGVDAPKGGGCPDEATFTRWIAEKPPFHLR